MNLTNRMTKRIFSLLLSLLMLLSLVPFSVLAEGEVIRTDKDTYTVGEPVMVTTNFSGTSAWVGLYKKDETYNPQAGGVKSIFWYYLDEQPNPVNILATRNENGRSAEYVPGEYKVVLFNNDSYTPEAVAEFTLTEEPSAGITLRLEAERKGDDVAVSLISGSEFTLGGMAGTLTFDKNAFTYGEGDSDVVDYMENLGEGSVKFAGDTVPSAEIKKDDVLASWIFAPTAGFQANTEYTFTVDLDEFYDDDEYETNAPVTAAYTDTSSVDVLATDKTEYTWGDPIMVTTNFSGNKAWVGLYKKGETYNPDAGGSYSIYWYYLDGNPNPMNILEAGDLNHRAAEYVAGEYKVVLFNNDSYTPEKAVEFTVVHVETGRTTVPPTCTEEGYTLVTYNDGTSEKIDVVPALGHDWGAWTYNAENKTHTHVCTHDGNHTETQACTFDEGTVIKEATETENGLVRYTCTVCGGTYDVETSKKEIDHTEIIKEATCEEEGILRTYYTDGSWIDTPIPKLGHDWSEWQYDSSTHTHTHVCSRCGKSETENCTFVLVTDGSESSYVCTVCHGNYPAVPLSTDKEVYTYGDPIMVTTAFEGNKAWVGLYKKNETYNPQAGGVASIFWYYLDEEPNPVNILETRDENGRAGDYKPGEYKVVLFNNDSYNPEAVVEFTVEPVPFDGITLRLEAEREEDQIVVSLISDTDFTLGGMSGNLSFDKEAFTFVKGRSGVLDYMENAGEGSVRFLGDAVPAEEIKKDDVIAYWTFATAGDFASDQVYEFTIDLGEFYGADNKDYETNAPLTAVYTERTLLSTDKEVYMVGEPIMVTTGYEAEGAWVGLYRKDDIYGEEADSVKSIYWYYLSEQPNPVNILATRNENGRAGDYGAGEFKVILFADGGYNAIAQVDITIEEEDISDTVFTIFVDGKAVSDGDEIHFPEGTPRIVYSVTADGAAGTSWIGRYNKLVGKGTDFSTTPSDDWYFISEHGGEDLFIEGPEAGKTYTLVLFGDGGYNKVLQAVTIVIDRETATEEIIKEPTCTDYGTKKVTYPDGSEEFIPIPPLGHDWGDWVHSEENGVHQHTRTCARCGEKETLPCVFDDGVVTKEATETEEGILTFTCTVCGATYTEIIPRIVVDRGVTRVFGHSRYDTAILLADALKRELGVDKFDAIIVATGNNYADALSGAYLGYVKKAPILLVHSSVIDQVKAYIKDNLAEGGTLYLLGGPTIVPQELAEGLGSANVVRLSGHDRFDTNLAILSEAGVSGEDILVADGMNYADSLSASAVMRPILLVNKKLTEDQKTYLKGLSSSMCYLVGGTGVLPEALEQDLRTIFGKVTRLGGHDRFETSVLVAREFFPNPTCAVVAYGMNFPDGLCGGTVAAYMGGPLLLVHNNYTASAIEYAADKGITGGFVLGGPTFVSDKSVRDIFHMGPQDEINVIS
ncbi:MAG: cell wall-binding repeat-containing protein [Oscillospiraceae bacterium]|nr:cell wall-binding repeat-containing protein [Oscillospiraceae bacterium]